MEVDRYLNDGWNNRFLQSQYRIAEVQEVQEENGNS
jgi:hypothetical protein